MFIFAHEIRLWKENYENEQTLLSNFDSLPNIDIISFFIDTVTY